MGLKEKLMDKFMIEGRYEQLFGSHGIDIKKALKKAGLPEETFSVQTPVVEEQAYYRFMDTLSTLSGDCGLPIRLACTSRMESFCPQMFASYCSRNGKFFIEKLIRYKKLVGPLEYKMYEEKEQTTVVLENGSVYEIPPFLVEAEFAFLVEMLRRSTRQLIVPVQVNMKKPVENETFSGFFRCRAIRSSHNSIVFRNTDLNEPFLNYNEEMWEYYEMELLRKLSEIDSEKSAREKVRSALTASIPEGIYGIDDISKIIGLSTRTLQRKLKEEHTTYQKELSDIRKKLALDYLDHTDLSTYDIACRLGYQEMNSFLRAFVSWTGMNVTKYRKSLR